MTEDILFYFQWRSMSYSDATTWWWRYVITLF